MIAAIARSTGDEYAVADRDFETEPLEDMMDVTNLASDTNYSSNLLLMRIRSRRRKNRTGSKWNEWVVETAVRNTDTETLVGTNRYINRTAARW